MDRAGSEFGRTRAGQHLALRAGKTRPRSGCADPEARSVARETRDRSPCLSPVKVRPHKFDLNRCRGKVAASVAPRSPLWYPRHECIRARAPADPLRLNTGAHSSRCPAGGKSVISRERGRDFSSAKTKISGASFAAADGPGGIHVMTTLPFWMGLGPSTHRKPALPGQVWVMVAGSRSSVADDRESQAHDLDRARNFGIQFSGTKRLFQRRNALANEMSTLAQNRFVRPPRGSVEMVVGWRERSGRTSHIEHMQQKYFHFSSEYIAALRETWLHFPRVRGERIW